MTVVTAEGHSCAGRRHLACCSALLCLLQNIERLCCGMMFDTRGVKRAAGIKVAESSTELLLASQMEKLPIGALSCGRLDKFHSGSIAALASPLQPAACSAQLHLRRSCNNWPSLYCVATRLPCCCTLLPCSG